MKNIINIDIITLNNKWDRINFNIKEAIELGANTTLSQLNIQNIHAEFAVNLIDDNEITELNAKYRKKNKATNVLSFPLQEINPENLPQLPLIGNYIYMGDIFISYETLEKESTEQNKTLYAHFMHLYIHSILHLIGFDHENDIDAKKMEQMEENILAQLEIRSPYA
jgi:probable rRNA maturation factor